MAKEDKGGGLTTGLNKKDQKLFSEFLKSQVSSKEDSVELSKEEARLKKEEYGYLSKINELQKVMAAREEDILKLVNDRIKSTTKMKDLQDEIKKSIDDQADTEKELFTSNKLVLLKKKKIAELANDTSLTGVVMLHYLKQEVAEEENKQKLLETQLYQIDEYIKGSTQLLDIERQSVKESNNKINLGNSVLSGLQAAVTAEEKGLKATQEHVETLHKAVAAAEKLAERYDEVFDSFDEIDAWMSKIPGGGLMSKALGLDGIGKKIKTQVVNRIAEGQVAGKGLVASVAPLLPLLIAAGLLAKAFEFDTELTQFAKDMDLSKDSALGLSIEADHIAGSLGLAGVTGKEVQASMAALKEEFGTAAIAADQDLVGAVTTLTARVGLTNEEALALNSTATLLGTNLNDLAASSYDMADGLIGGKQMLKEMSKLPKSLVAGFKGTTQQLQKAIVKGKLFGLTLEQAAKAGESMLDIESSVEKEMTANVLLGKSMNLNKARLLAMEGKTAELQDEILNKAGSLEDYQKLAPIQQKAFADALGMSTEDMAEMLTKSEEMRKVGLSSVEVEEKLKGTLEEQQKTLDGMAEGEKKAFLQKLVNDKKQEEATAKFQTSLAKMMEALSKVMLPIVEGVGYILDILGLVIDKISHGVELFNHWYHSLTGAKEELKEGDGIMGKILKGALAVGAAILLWKVGKKMIGGAKSMLGFGGGGAADAAGAAGAAGGAGSKDVGNAKSMADKLNGIAKSVTSFFDILRNAVKGIMGIITDVFKGVGEALAGFFKAFSSISFTDLIKGALALGIMGGALWVIGEALQKFADIGLDDLGIAALALIGLTAAVVGLGMILPLILAGSLALGVMSAAFWVFGMAAASVADSMPALASGFKLFGDIDGGNLIGVAAGIGALSLALAGYGAGSALSGIGSAIGSLFDEDPVEKFNRFTSIDSNKLLQVASAITALGSAFKLFTSSVSSIGDTSGITSTIDKVMELHDAMSESPIEEAVNSVASGIGSIFDAATSWVSSIMPDLESVGSTSTAAGGGATATKEATLTEVSGLLKELIAKVDQPVQIKIGGRVVDEMEKQTSLRKTYNTKMDSGYGTFG